MKHILNTYKKVKRNKALPSYKDISHPKSISEHILFQSYVNYHNINGDSKSTFLRIFKFFSPNSTHLNYSLILSTQPLFYFLIDLLVYWLKYGGMV